MKYHYLKYKAVMSLVLHKYVTSAVIAFSFMPSSALAVNINATPGESVISLGNVNAEVTLTSISSAFSAAANRADGFAVHTSSTAYNCLSNSNEAVVGNMKGYKVAEDIIIGLQSTNATGVASVGAGAQPASANYKDITVKGTWSSNGSYTVTPTQVPSAMWCGSAWPEPTDHVWNPQKKNNKASIQGKLFLYVGPNAKPGSYTLPNLYLIKAATSNGDLVNQQIFEGGTLTVSYPPCSISTPTEVIFDTTKGLPVINPTSSITVNCGINNGRAFQIGISGTPVAPSMLVGTHAISLHYGDGTIGGLVRGYIGSNAATDAVGCLDRASSIPFSEKNQGLNFMLLGANTSGASQTQPLVWSLCPNGTEKPGKATGTAELDVVYK
ncbi:MULTISPECIES: hypothetical protein [Providencia]|uniref:hypothetical protein n=1 Tax=Providencia TaxID=586 RepID=UPI002349693E|nr:MULTISPECIES: hypothetical protein [unclassified Providencia]ELR5121875.1 hypothetical protein [Providencia stuartii]